MTWAILAAIALSLVDVGAVVWRLVLSDEVSDAVSDGVSALVSESSPWSEASPAFTWAILAAITLALVDVGAVV